MTWPQRLTNLSIYLSVSRGGVDPDQREDISGHSHLFLLHIWSDGPSRTCLLAERLEEAAVSCLCSPFLVLRLQLVSVDFQNKCLYVYMFVLNLLLSDWSGGTPSQLAGWF